MGSDDAPSIREIVELIRQELVLKEDDEIYQCGHPALAILKDWPDACMQLSYQKLHDVPYREVRTCWRRLYADASVWKALRVLESFVGGETDGEEDFESRLANGSRESVEKGGSGTGEEGQCDGNGQQKDNDWITEVVRTLDMALILTAAPGREELIELVFSALGGFLAKEEKERRDTNQQALPTTSELDDRSPKRRKISPTKTSLPDSPIPPTFPTAIPEHLQPNLLSPLPRLSAPTLSVFEHKIIKERKPFIITDSLSHWPALSEPSRSWSNPSYLLSHTLGGRRLVPVEIGRNYTDSEWGQKILSFGDFTREYMFHSLELPPAPEKENPMEEKGKEKEMKQTGYLAQHDLFTQIPSLRSDIAIPDYCYTDPPPPSPSTNTKPQPKLETPLLNAWFGPANTVSPLHTDPYHNILAQVVGYKYVRLYAPEQAARLYPRGVDENGVDMGNTSQIDLDEAIAVWPEISPWRKRAERAEHPQQVRSSSPAHEDTSADKEEDEGLKEGRTQFEQRFPGFKDAEFVEGVLGPGECLYIPVGWWHYVRSLTPSFSVSFWWN